MFKGIQNVQLISFISNLTMLQKNIIYNNEQCIQLLNKSRTHPENLIILKKKLKQIISQQK